MEQSNAKEFSVNFKAKFQSDMEDAVLTWMDGVLCCDKMCCGEKGPEALRKKLDVGITLCELMNKIKPGTIPKYTKKQNMTPFQKMENIGRFNEAIREYGVKPEYIFVTNDLYKGTNLTQVLIGLRALGTKATENGVQPPIKELKQKVLLE